MKLAEATAEQQDAPVVEEKKKKAKTRRTKSFVKDKSMINKLRDL